LRERERQPSKVLVEKGRKGLRGLHLSLLIINGQQEELDNISVLWVG